MNFSVSFKPHSPKFETKDLKLRHHYECGRSFYFTVVISFPVSVLKRWIFEEIQTMVNLFKLPMPPLPESGD